MEAVLELEETETCQARIAAVLLIPEFRRLARIYARKEPEFQEDLVQILCLETLLAADLHSMAFYCNNARWKAADVMRQRRLEALLMRWR